MYNVNILHSLLISDNNIWHDDEDDDDEDDDSEKMKPSTGELLVVVQCFLHLIYSKVAKGCRFL